jgi:hypothetical protein
MLPATIYQPLPPPAVAKSLTIVVLRNKPKNRKRTKVTKYFVFLKIIASLCRFPERLEGGFGPKSRVFSGDTGSADLASVSHWSRVDHTLLTRFGRQPYRNGCNNSVENVRVAREDFESEHGQA